MAVVTLNPSPTEVTTAATDAALGLLCVGLLLWLVAHTGAPPWKKQIWGSVFGLLAASSFLGAWTHGFALSASLTAALWRPLYLSLGLAVAMFVVGAVSDWRGPRTGLRLRPWAAAAGLGFFAVTQLVPSGFAMFIAYEGVAMLSALAIYLRLQQQGRLPGVRYVTTGLTLTLAAAAVQQSRLQATIVWPFDHNGLFHLVQIVSLLVIATGLRRGLTRGTPRPEP